MRCFVMYKLALEPNKANDQFLLIHIELGTYTEQVAEENRSLANFSYPLVAGAWTEREKMYHGGSFLKLADDDMDIQNPEAQNRELGGF